MRKGDGAAEFGFAPIVEGMKEQPRAIDALKAQNEARKSPDDAFEGRLDARSSASGSLQSSEPRTDHPEMSYASRNQPNSSELRSVISISFIS